MLLTGKRYEHLFYRAVSAHIVCPSVATGTQSFRSAGSSGESSSALNASAAGLVEIPCRTTPLTAEMGRLFCCLLLKDA